MVLGCPKGVMVGTVTPVKGVILHARYDDIVAEEVS